VSATASAVICAVKFVNSFARCQHLFYIAAKATDVDSNFISYSARLFLFKFHVFNSLVVMISSSEFHRTPFRIFIFCSRRTEDGTEDRTEAATERQKHNASSAIHDVVHGVIQNLGNNGRVFLSNVPTVPYLESPTHLPVQYGTFMGYDND